MKQIQNKTTVKLLVGLVLPQLGGSDMGPVLDEGNVFAIATEGNDDTALQGQEAHTLLCLETEVTDYSHYQWNCSASVEPASAVVEDIPPAMT